jgi:hypothetical protein
MQFKCTHRCILHGGIVEKGIIIEADETDIDKPGYQNLKTSFVKMTSEDEKKESAKKSVSKKTAAAIDALRKKLEDLKVTAPDDATQEELENLLAQAVDPNKGKK